MATMLRKTFLRTMAGAAFALTLPVDVYGEDSDDWIDEKPTARTIKKVPISVPKGHAGSFTHWPRVEVITLGTDYEPVGRRVTDTMEYVDNRYYVRFQGDEKQSRCIVRKAR